MCLKVVEDEMVRAATARGEDRLTVLGDEDRIRPGAADHAFEALRSHVDGHAVLPKCHGDVAA